jgi:inhibitor of cysteine peptidase
MRELICISLRSRFTWSLVLCVPACLCLATQALCLPVNQDKKTITATDKNNGGKISLAKGEILIVKLDAQPGTGYSWRVAKNDPGHLNLVGDSEFVSAGHGIPGAVQPQIFRFKAQASGPSVIELHYARPWEKNAQPSRTYRLEVQVQ